MVDLLRHTTKLDKRIAVNNDINAATILTLRYWQASCLCNNEAEARVLVQRANHTALTAHRRNPSHLSSYVLAIFMSIESENYDNANAMLDKAMGYKSFLRTHAVRQYANMCFLYAYLEIKQKRRRVAKKYWQLLMDNMKGVGNSAEFSIMLGFLHLESEEYPDAYKHFWDAFASGCNSILLYEGFYRYYRTTLQVPDSRPILAVLIYVANRGADIAKLALQHQTLLLKATDTNPVAGEQLYKISGYPRLLQEICNHRISCCDVSYAAYLYYKEAESRQIIVPGLFQALIKSAYANKVEHINHYTMEQFLKTEEMMEQNFAIYIYHILLSEPSLQDLIPSQQANILQLAKDCLHMGKAGKQINSLYYYYWVNCNEQNRDSQVEEILFKQLTYFSVLTPHNSQVRHVYVTEPEQRGMVIYDMDDNLVIEATNQDFSYICLGAGKRTVLDEKLIIQRMIPGVGVELYQHFFDKGDRRFYLLTFLANYYLEAESLDNSAMAVFEAVLAEKAVSKAYRMRILVALGWLHCSSHNFEQALACYGEVDEDALDNNFTEQVLGVYMQTGKFERASNLVSKRHTDIANKVLLETVCNLLTQPIDYSPLALVAYKLLISGTKNEQLMACVLEHYQASYSELILLLQVYEGDSRLDVRIVKAAIWMAKWDISMQNAFERLWNNDYGGSEIKLQFVEYATYEMLVNAICPKYETLQILEYHCLHNNEILLIWGLASCYLSHNITTPNTQQIMNMAFEGFENAGFVFPIFKENKPSRVPFVEKLQPFLYRGLPDKNYRLYYRIDDETEFTSIPMQYVRYGIYVACLPLFYNEEVTYYFSEEMQTGSITTKEEIIKNTTPFLYDHPTDQFFAINNAIIYEQMFKHDEVEKAVDDLVKDIQAVRSELL